MVLKFEMSTKHETRRRSSCTIPNESIAHHEKSTLDVNKNPLLSHESLFHYNNRGNDSPAMYTVQYNSTSEKDGENKDNCCFPLFADSPNINDMDNNNEDPMNQSKLSHLYTWLNEKLNDEIFDTQKTLFLFCLDWVLDFGTSIAHFSKGNWIEGTLTYLIVLFAGAVTTFGFLKYKEIRVYLQKDTRASGLWLFILLHVPSWFLFVCLKRKLDWLKIQRCYERKRSPIITGNNKRGDETTNNEDIDEKLHKYSDLILKAGWWDTVLEAKPQALLQTIFLIETSIADFRIWDYMPLLLSLWAIHAITKKIYAVVLDAAVEDKTPIFSKLYGYTYTVLSNMAPAMCIHTTRNQFDSDTGKFFVTIGTLISYYTFLVIIERIVALVSNRSNVAYGKVFHVFMGMIFILCFCQWVLFNRLSSSRKVIVVSVLYLITFVSNLICFYNAMEFANVSFRLKNEMIEKQSTEIKSKIKSLAT